jgi:nucleoside-triphosphatase
LHIFLSGPRNIGKSTVIRHTLDILLKQGPVKLGGFFTWRGGAADPHIYLRPAQIGRESEIYRLATYNAENGGLSCHLQVFEQTGARLLVQSADVDLLIMDELGFLESKAPVFRQAVITALSGAAPVLGVMRLGDIPWHKEIKSNPRVVLYEINKKNRDALPRELAAQLAAQRKCQ